MQGLEFMEKIRRKGFVPPNPVWIEFGGQYRRPKYRTDFVSPVLTAEENEAVGRLDMRPLVGLDVVVSAPKLTSQVREMFAALRRVPARSISVLVVELGEKIGWMWDAEHGTRAF